MKQSEDILFSGGEVVSGVSADRAVEAKHLLLQFNATGPQDAGFDHDIVPLLTAVV